MYMCEAGTESGAGQLWKQRQGNVHMCKAGTCTGSGVTVGQSWKQCKGNVHMCEAGNMHMKWSWAVEILDVGNVHIDVVSCGAVRALSVFENRLELLTLVVDRPHLS